MGELLTVVETEKAPQAIGPYSQGICAGELLFTAGQGPLDPQHSSGRRPATGSANRD